MLDVFSQLFFLSNTIFSIFLLYTLSFFQQLQEKETPQIKPVEERFMESNVKTKGDELQNDNNSKLDESLLSNNSPGFYEPVNKSV